MNHLQVAVAAGAANVLLGLARLSIPNLLIGVVVLGLIGWRALQDTSADRAVATRARAAARRRRASP